MKIIRANPTIVAAALIFVLALCIRFGYWSQYCGTALDRWHEWDQTDMSTYLEQARLLRTDGWLAKDPFRPYHLWHASASEQKWASWVNPRVFYQAPAYSYVLAAAGRLFDDSLPLVKAVQLIIGAGTCVLMFLIALRLAGLFAGCLAGILACLYAPLFYFEPQLLRVGPGVFFLALILFCLVFIVGRSSKLGTHGIVTLCVGIGLLTGLFAIFHEMSKVMIAVVVTSLAVHFGRRGIRYAATAVLAITVGYLIGFSPLMARNIAVGAPPFAVSGMTSILFVNCNEATAPVGGSIPTQLSPTAIRILDQAEGGTAEALKGIWDSYSGDLGLLISNWGQRFAMIWNKWEVPANTSYAFYMNIMGLPKWMPDFRWLFPAAFSAVIILGIQVVRAKLASFGSEHKSGSYDPPSSSPTDLSTCSLSGHLVLLLYITAMTASLSLVYAVARYRLYLVPFFLVYAAVFVKVVVVDIRARRWLRIPLAICLVLIGLYIHNQVTRDDFRPQDPRIDDYGVAVNLASGVSEPEHVLVARLATHAKHDYPNKVGQSITIRAAEANFWLGQKKMSDGKSSEAIGYFRNSVQWVSNNPISLNALAWVLATVPGDQNDDSSDAIKYATAACELTNYVEPMVLDTLAATYANAGDYPHAVEIARKAVTLAQEQDNQALVQRVTERLVVYGRGEPYRLNGR